MTTKNMLMFLVLGIHAVLLIIHAQQTDVPLLSGKHFRVTVTQQDGFVDMKGSSSFSGYCIFILDRLAERANFTYELLTPSGMGTLCEHNNTQQPQRKAYDPYYRQQYLCGQSDVHDLPISEYTTDMYLSLYYITPDRLTKNQFSVPFHPPTTGSLTMYGTSTHIRTFDDLLHLQASGKHGPVCIQQNTAQESYMIESFPQLRMVRIPGGDHEFHRALQDGICDLMIAENPVATRFVYLQHQKGDCTVRGKAGKNRRPIGVIGDPLDFGFSQFAIGIRKDISLDIVYALNFWLTILMGCPPSEGEVGLCRGKQDSLSALYADIGGNGGNECGYVAFPRGGDDRFLSPGAIAGMVLGIVAVLATAFTGVFYQRSLDQQKRYKKRFVQQIARNLTIGPSPGCIPADQLAKEIEHIGGKKGTISRQDLAKWMYDVKLTFLSEKDFDALWGAMDIDGRGAVDAIEFITFLSCCGGEFEEVYAEQQKLSKMERLKFAARRLENINEVGEEGVRRIENRIERRSRHGVLIPKANEFSNGKGGRNWMKHIENVSKAFSDARDESES